MARTGGAEWGWRLEMAIDCGPSMQRDFGFTYGLEALGNHPLAQQLQEAWNTMYPSPLIPNPASLGYTPLNIGTTVSAGRFTLRLDAATGAIGYLLDNVTGQTWADAGSTIGVVHYQTYNETVRS